MNNNINKQLLINIAKKAISLDSEYKEVEEPIEKAMKIFKSIKKMEKNAEGFENCKMTSEQFFMESDLSKIFNFEYKGMTLNQKYMEHQSLIVNTLTKMIIEGEL